MDRKSMVPLSSMKWLLAAARSEGVEPEQWLPVLGITPEQVDDPGVSIPFENVANVRKLIKEKSGNTAFALHAGENIPHGEFGVADYVCSSSPDVRLSLVNLQKYFHLMVHPDVRLTFTLKHKEGHLEYSAGTYAATNAGWYEQGSAEFTFSTILNRIRANTKSRCKPKQLHFKHSKPEHVNEYRRIFQTELYFDSPRNLMIIDAEVLSLRQTQFDDSTLHKILSGYAESALEKLSTANNFKHQVLQVLKDEFRYGKPTIASVAEKLCVSQRTLHRKLQDEGTSFSEVRDNWRKELAQFYLSDATMTIEEISYLLGYSNPSAFYRSFKRLTGASPQSCRQ